MQGGETDGVGGWSLQEVQNIPQREQLSKAEERWFEPERW